MDNPEKKLEKSLSSIIPVLKNKRPMTVEEAIAPLQKTIDNLNSVCETRKMSAESKAKQIEKLISDKSKDESQSVSADKLSQRLTALLYGDDA